LLDSKGKKVKNKGPPGYALRKVWPYTFEKRISPFSLSQKSKSLTKMAISMYVKIKLNPEKNKVKQAALENYLTQLHLNACTTENAMFDLFEVPLFPRVPILEDLKDKPVSFVYGEFDWVVQTGAEVLITHAKKGPHADQCQLYVVPGAEH
jgi:pimeloyl-ACP methyl ester carboxylesterase